jgi:hypothetical protein
VVSSLEKAIPSSVPVVGSALHAIDSGLGAAQGVSSLAGLGGQALRNAASGNVGALAQNASQATGLLGTIGQNFNSAVANGGQAAAQGAVLMA